LGGVAGFKAINRLSELNPHQADTKLHFITEPDFLQSINVKAYLGSKFSYE